MMSEQESTVGSTPRIRRLCISADLDRYSRRDADDQRRAQNDLSGLLEAASRAAGLDRTTWDRQPAGDGELAVLPPGIDEGQVISEFVRALSIALYRHNHRLNEFAALRLRIAMHAGMTQMADLGFAGQAPIMVARLRDCPQVRAALADQSGADFVLVISQQLYDDHVGHEYPDFNTTTFRRTRVEMPEKEFFADAWIYSPDAGHPLRLTKEGTQQRDRADAGPAGRGDDRRSGGVYVSGGTVQAGIIAGRDHHGSSS